jgi:dTDP-4-amino-4,6-dideoxygalactose transaminase
VVDLAPDRLYAGAEQYAAAMTDAAGALVVTHMRGFPAGEIDAIRALSQEHQILLVEDCAQAWGVVSPDLAIGTAGDFAFFSTQANKLVSSGEGGLAVAAQGEWAGQLRRLHGYAVEGSGPTLNYRMSAPTALLAAAELRNLPVIRDALRQLQAAVCQAIRPIGSALGHRILGDYEASNGITVAVLSSDAGAAVRLRRELDKRGVLSYQPCSSEDFHQARRWDADPGELPGLASVEHYVDIPIPLLEQGESPEEFVSRVGESVGCAQ